LVEYIATNIPTSFPFLGIRMISGINVIHQAVIGFGGRWQLTLCCFVYGRRWAFWGFWNDREMKSFFSSWSIVSSLMAFEIPMLKAAV
jgi:hypothetical protein